MFNYCTLSDGMDFLVMMVGDPTAAKSVTSLSGTRGSGFPWSTLRFWWW
jgi:hypothetical protein